MLPVQQKDDRASGAEGNGDRSVPGPGVAHAESGEVPNGIDAPVADLLPPGPLATLRLTPAPVRVECSGTRRVRAHALDAAGHAIAEPARFSWSLAGPVGTLEVESPGRAVLHASAVIGRGTIHVLAQSHEHEASAQVGVEIVDEIRPAHGDEGVPVPEFVNEPGAAWRSRVVDGVWRVNAAHRDYRTLADRPTLKLRYLAMLFAKEVVLRSSQDPRLEPPLEQLVEVAAFADRNLPDRKRRAE